VLVKEGGRAKPCTWGAGKKKGAHVLVKEGVCFHAKVGKGGPRATDLRGVVNDNTKLYRLVQIIGTPSSSLLEVVFDKV
jgi:hypothetical protein